MPPDREDPCMPPPSTALRRPSWCPGRAAAALTLLGLVAPLQGCVAVAAAAVVGTGVVQYHRNEVAQDFPIDLQRAWQATLEGLRALEIIPDSSELSRTEGMITAGNVSVRVERHPEGFTRVRVRVGTFHSLDHERRADILLQEIGEAIESQDELRAWVQR